MRRILAVVAVLLVVSGVLGMVVVRSREGSSGASVASADKVAMGTPVAAPGQPFEQSAARDVMVEPTSAQAASGGTGTTMSVADPAVAVPPDGLDQKVIRTADLSLIIADGGFDEAFDSASMVAKTYGGFVVDSATSGTKAKAGTLVIRVPSDRFDEAMSDLRGLGEEIDRESVTGTDVTDQFIDLEARLRSWQAQERVLLKLMAKANTINETMQVQNELQRVRYEIESIQGQLRVLRDQTSLATISVSMHERGAPVAKGEGDPKPSVFEALDRAWTGFLSVISAVIVGLGYVLPLAALAALGWFIYRRIRTRETGDPQPAKSAG